MNVEVIFVIEKLIKKISSSQAFSPDDNLGKFVNEYEDTEFTEENLDFVYAATKEDVSYAEFLKLVQKRDKSKK